MDNGEAKMQRIHNALNGLPAANKVVLTYLITFFRKCLEHRKNQATPAVIGKSFGTAFLHPRGEIPTQEVYIFFTILFILF